MSQFLDLDPTVARGMADQLNEELLGTDDGRSRGRELDEHAQRVFAQRFVSELIETFQAEEADAGRRKLDGDGVAALKRAVLDMSFQGGELWRVWRANPDILNLWAYGTGPIRIEQPDGIIEAIPAVATSDTHLRDMVMGLRAAAGRPDARWDPQFPELELIFKDGTRITASDFDSEHPFVTFRRPTLSEVTLEDLVNYNSMTEHCAAFLKACIDADQRILVGGKTNSGKTVLLRAFAAALPPDSAVMTAESQPELRLDKFPETYPAFVVPMSARRPNAHGKNGVTLGDLITRCQRLSPSVVIVGEVRAGSEAQALSKSLTQGYAVMSTIHASSAPDAIENAAMYYAEETSSDFSSSLSRVARGIDIAVFMGRDENDKRIVAEVAAINGGVSDAGELDHSLIFSSSGDGLAEPRDPLPVHLEKALGRVGYRHQPPEQGVAA